MKFNKIDSCEYMLRHINEIKPEAVVDEGGDYHYTWLNVKVPIIGKDKKFFLEFYVTNSDRDGEADIYFCYDLDKVNLVYTKLLHILYFKYNIHSIVDIIKLAKDILNMDKETQFYNLSIAINSLECCKGFLQFGSCIVEKIKDDPLIYANLANELYKDPLLQEEDGIGKARRQAVDILYEYVSSLI